MNAKELAAVLSTTECTKVVYFDSEWGTVRVKSFEIGHVTNEGHFYNDTDFAELQEEVAEFSKEKLEADYANLLAEVEVNYALEDRADALSGFETFAKFYNIYLTVHERSVRNLQECKINAKVIRLIGE